MSWIPLLSVDTNKNGIILNRWLQCPVENTLAVEEESDWIESEYSAITVASDSISFHFY